MRRLPLRGRPLLFTDLIHSDRDHDRFLLRDVGALTDDDIWAERKLLEIERASLISEGVTTTIDGSDALSGLTEPLTLAGWVRKRLLALQSEARRRAESLTT
jgi:hypothetical protein